MCMKKFSIRNSHAGKALGAKGVYITLAACLLALGGAGIAAYNKAMEDITDNLTISSVDSTAPKQADNKKTDVKKDESSKPDVDIQTQPNVMPVNGEILEPFSNGELVKSETLGYWKTHDGVDIKADLGEPVKAMNQGHCHKDMGRPSVGQLHDYRSWKRHCRALLQSVKGNVRQGGRRGECRGGHRCCGRHCSGGSGRAFSSALWLEKERSVDRPYRVY